MSPERNPEMIRPISPEQAIGAKIEQIPNEVIGVFNSLLAENVLNGHACIKQDDIMEILVGKGFDRGEIFRRHWLDVEDMYREAGWEVEYDKPGYGEESYPATFTFKALRR